jgi:predicted AlkP superfamily pyrophosphatase or phosphodiesterase
MGSLGRTAGSVLLSLAAAAAPLAAAAPKPAESSGRPRLVLLVAVDQMRYDYLTRFRDRFRGGFARLLAGGAVFTNAHLEHYPTVTAVGHSTMLTGATPARSGIVGNDWYDRETGRNVTSVFDPAVQLLGGGAGPASSPCRLLVSTLGDELKMAGRGSRVVGLSFKDRSAILPVGRMADAAFWLDTTTGRFVSSTWYFPALPAWAVAFNDRRPADAFASAEWRRPGPGAALFKKMPESPGPDLYAAVYESPLGNELLEAFGEAAIDGEGLGQHDTTDLLTVSFSSNDAVGHSSGPDSEEVRDITVRTDQVLGRLLDAVDRRVGPGRTLVILTSDHGVAPLPETMEGRHMPGGRIAAAAITEPVEAALASLYGAGHWIAGRAGSALYLNQDLVREKHLDEALVEGAAAQAVAAVPHVARVFTREQLLRGAVPPDPASQRVLRGFHAGRSGDLEILLEPYWMREAKGTTHGSPYEYDAHIPLILMGPGIAPGSYLSAVALNDLAPTLAALLGVEPPSGSVGRVLTEALTR